MPETLGSRIRYLRGRKGFSQVELAEAAGVALGTVQALESGGRQPQIVPLSRVAAALETTVEQLEGSE